MDRYAAAGAKKLLSLVRTKIRLAEEAGTLECRPQPLPLIQRLTGEVVCTVSEAKAYREKLAKNISFSDKQNVASIVFQCMDIIEGVKYLYEPAKYMSNIDEAGMDRLVAQARQRGVPVNILLMTNQAPEGVNLYIGEQPPQGAFYLSGVPTSLATFLDYAFMSPYLSAGWQLKNIRSVLGRRTLIINAIHCAFGAYGAELLEEQ